MALEVIGLDETDHSPRVDFVVGHLPFREVGEAVGVKYGNPEFADSLYRYEYMVPGAPDKPEDTILNARPNAPGAVAVTILYFGNSTVAQL